MESQLETEYLKEEIKKCNLCNHWIETEIKRIVVCNRRCYYHLICYDLMIQKMENLGFLYSC